MTTLPFELQGVHKMLCFSSRIFKIYILPFVSVWLLLVLPKSTSRQGWVRGSYSELKKNKKKNENTTFPERSVPRKVFFEVVIGRLFDFKQV